MAKIAFKTILSLTSKNTPKATTTKPNDQVRKYYKILQNLFLFSFKIKFGIIWVKILCFVLRMMQLKNFRFVIQFVCCCWLVKPELLNKHLLSSAKINRRSQDTHKLSSLFYILRNWIIFQVFVLFRTCAKVIMNRDFAQGEAFASLFVKTKKKSSLIFICIIPHGIKK